MRLLLRKIKSFQGLSPRQRKFVIWVFGLSIYRYLLRFLGSDKAFTEKLKVDYDKVANPTEDQMAIAFDIAKAIRIADQYIPWPNVCRHQAWQAVVLCNKYQLPYGYHVGLYKNEEKLIDGHCWVEISNSIITGNIDVTKYKLINFINHEQY